MAKKIRMSGGRLKGPYKRALEQDETLKASMKALLVKIVNENEGG